MRWRLVPLILLNFTFAGEAYDIPPAKVHYAKCYTSPRGLTNPHWTMHQKHFEGTKCWHSSPVVVAAVAPPILPVPNINKFLFQEYEMWLGYQKFICLVAPTKCILPGGQSP